MWNIINITLLILAAASFIYGWKIGQQTEEYDCFLWLFIGIILLAAGSFTSMVVKSIWS